MSNYKLDGQGIEKAEPINEAAKLDWALRNYRDGVITQQVLAEYQHAYETYVQGQIALDKEKQDKERADRELAHATKNS